MRLLPPSSSLLPTLRALLASAVLASSASALAFCQPPNDSPDWDFVGEIVQNIRVRSVTHRNVSSWTTVHSVANRTGAEWTVNMSATTTDSTSVSSSILEWGLGRNSASTFTHRVEVSIPNDYRARLRRQRRQEVQDLLWDVVCAWRNRRTGAAAITSYGRNYSGTWTWTYDAFEVRLERI